MAASSAGASGDAAEARFRALLDELAGAMPDSESAARIRTGFGQHWESPPLAEMEGVLRRSTPLREARQLLFFPEPADMHIYAALVARAPRGAPPEHPQLVVRLPALGLLYMKHSHSWELMRPFLLAGGLKVLGDAIGDDNVYLRAQAIDVLASLTSTELHDWFAEPTLDRDVHRRWLDLASKEANFVSNVQANLTESFPGGSYYCLQVRSFRSRSRALAENIK